MSLQSSQPKRGSQNRDTLLFGLLVMCGIDLAVILVLYAISHYFRDDELAGMSLRVIGIVQLLWGLPLVVALGMQRMKRARLGECLAMGILPILSLVFTPAIIEHYFPTQSNR
ncbi:MAG TPA: hypothetical protein VK843_20070 [Planctomycetota bacterium]|nr:hypothetical protein [Planctomycetota bacterium]